MLTAQEKAYCRALDALRKKDYKKAEKEFEECKSLFANGRGIRIISEATSLLVMLEDEKAKLEKRKNEIEEVA